MVKREPNLLWSRLVVLFWIFFAVMYLGYIPFQMEPRNRLFPFIVYFFIAATNIVNALRVERYWRRQQQRREHATQGDKNLLVEQQPTADTAVLALPFTITQRVAKRWNIVWIVGLILLFALLIPLFVFGLLLQTKSSSDVVVLLLTFVFILIIVFVLLAVSFLQCYQQLVVDEQGMHVRVGLGRVHFVRWDEARLFAISTNYQRNVRGGIDQNIFSPYYEIASAKDIVRWRWLRNDKKVLLTMSEPTVSFEEYNKQMQALLSLVVEKTHLALYDVRPATHK